jgi:hypothetical protein
MREGFVKQVPKPFRELLKIRRSPVRNATQSFEGCQFSSIPRNASQLSKAVFQPLSLLRDVRKTNSR